MKLWMFCRTSLIVLSVLTFFLCVLFFYFDYWIYDIFPFRRVDLANVHVTNTTKRILFWNTMFGNKTFYMGEGDIFHRCPVNDCVATHYRRYAALSEYDAVLFHSNELTFSDLPKTRSPRQWYVFVNLESPVNRPLVSEFYEAYFNLTMTYRLDSDIVWTYGVVRDVNEDRIVAPMRNTSWAAFYNQSGDREGIDQPKEALSRTIQGKTKPVIWFVSNCNARSGRQKYVNELTKHIPVDIYGACGRNHCPLSKDCFVEVAEPGYFFYLSFENSLCDDYVTEKLYNALRYNVVPIVYGGANYSQFAPPRSYIDALDFDEPKDLADYLKRLMKNPREYSEYFAWKRYYKVEGGISSAICNLCRFLHEHEEPRSYSFLSDWYSRSKCPLQEFLRDRNYLTGSVWNNKD